MSRGHHGQCCDSAEWCWMEVMIEVLHVSLLLFFKHSVIYVFIYNIYIYIYMCVVRHIEAYWSHCRCMYIDIYIFIQVISNQVLSSCYTVSKDSISNFTSYHVTLHGITSHHITHTHTTIWYSKFQVTCLTRFCKGSFGFLICTKKHRTLKSWNGPDPNWVSPSHCNHLDRCVASMPCYPTAECRRPWADAELEVESRKGLVRVKPPSSYTSRHQALAQERQKWLWQILFQIFRLFFPFFPL